MKIDQPARAPGARGPWALALAAALTVSCMGDAPYGGSVDDAASTPKSATPQAVSVPPAIKAPANGFDEAIAWEPLESGLARGKASGRPLMVVVHADWCSRCKELKPKFSEDEIVKLSERFIMVNLDQDHEPRSFDFTPDGDYIPRVMFVDPKSQTVHEDLLNARRTKTRYFYTPADDLIGVRKKALSKYERT